MDDDQFNQTLADFKNQSGINDTWNDNDVREYIKYLLKDSNGLGWLSRSSQCGYYYASLPPMLLPSMLLLMFALCSPRWRKTLTWQKVLFIIFSQITIPAWTIYLMVTSKYEIKSKSQQFVKAIDFRKICRQILQNGVFIVSFPLDWGNHSRACHQVRFGT